MVSGVVKEPLVRNRILDISKEIFFARGFSKVTVDELAEKLGMSKKTIYAHFKSKDEMVSSVLERHMAEVVKKRDEILNSPADFMERLYNLCALISDAISQKSPEFMADLQKRRGDLWEKLEEHRRANILSTSSRMMDEGVRLGLIREDVEKDIANLVLLSSVTGIINPHTLAAHSLTGAGAFDGIIRILFDGILTDTARLRASKFRKAEV
jgi:AcrR family transcriptional regulator